MQAINLYLDKDIEAKAEKAIATLMDLIERNHPLALLCSGGKDSSVVTLLGLEAIRRAHAAGIVQAQHYVATSDTTVENPAMHKHVLGFLADIEEFCEQHQLPVTVRVSEPTLASQFVVSTIGRGTLVRSVQNSVKDGSTKRQCSDDWKVQPQLRLKRAFAEEAASDGFREPVSVLGTRYAESAVRSRLMAERDEQATQVTRGEHGDLTISVVAGWSVDEIWSFLAMFTDEAMYPFPSPVPRRTIVRLHDLYRDANDGVCGVVLGEAGQRKPCSARTGCFTCQMSGEKDQSLESMIAEPQHAHMAGLNRFRNYLAATQWDLSAREIVGRTVSKAGYVKIAPDVYSFDYRMDLLRYLLTLDAMEVDRAEAHEGALNYGNIPGTELNRELCAVQFQMINFRQLVAIDFQLGMHQHCPHAHPAIAAWYEIHVLGRRYHIPDVPAPVSKAPIPSFGWFEVGDFNKDVPTDGLRDYLGELWNKYLEPAHVSAYAQTTEGERITYFEEDEQLTVDAEMACTFVTCQFDAKYYHQLQFFTGLDSSRFLLSKGILKLPKGMSAKYQYMAKRGQYFANLAQRYDLAPAELEQYVKDHAISDEAHSGLLKKADAGAYPLLDLFDAPAQLSLV
ncbi:hypothetical protein [Duganella vulcania]|uniref:hypothetical protein n=1 Tax=Duganella vulcania TaxID=2692166 RepID=UPI001582EE88|nr:hypothetical protein [Duganella vulcania]